MISEIDRNRSHRKNNLSINKIGRNRWQGILILKWIFWTWGCYLASNTNETAPSILFLMTSATTPGAVFTRFHFFFVCLVSWFVLIDLYMSKIRSPKTTAKLIRTLTYMVFFFLTIFRLAKPLHTSPAFFRLQMLLALW